MTEIQSEPLAVDTSLKENPFTPTRKLNQLRQDLMQIESKVLGESKLNITDQNIQERTTERPCTPGDNDKKKNVVKNFNLKLKDPKFLMRDVSTPGSQNSNDIQFKILNEMLNSQSEDRMNLNTKIPSRFNENKKQLNLNKTNESAFDMNTTKIGIEESEEVRAIQEKINELTARLQSKIETLESRKSRLDTDSTNPKSEEKLSQEQYLLRKKLENIQTQRATLRSKMNIDAAKEKLKKLKKETANYTAEISKLEESIKRREMEIAEQERIIEGEFGVHIRQFEEAIRNIQEEKLAIYNKMNEAQLLYSQNLEIKAMLKEDLNAKLLQRAEIVAQREELDEIFEGLKASNKVEIQFYTEEAQLKEELQKTSKYLNEVGIEKKKVLPQFEQVLEDIKDLSNKVFEIDKKYQILLAEKNEKIVADNNEIDSIENFINTKARELGILELDKMFEQICSYFSGHIEKEILSKQLMLIEDEEKKITEKFEQKEASIMEAITILRSKPEDPMTLHELQDLHNKLEQLKIRHELRKEAIQKWKDEVREVLTEKSEREAEDEVEGLNQDKQLEKIFKMMEEKGVDPEEQNKLREQFYRYLNSIEQHELYIHQKLQEEINLQEEKKVIEDQIERKKQEKAVLDEKMKRIDEEFNKTLLYKKNLEQELSEKRAIIEHHLLKEADAAFNAYLSQQSSTFDAITRTYGQKAAQNIKNDHHKEFIEITKGNQLKRIERFRQVQNDLKYLDQTINHNIFIVDNEILPTLKKIVGSLTEGKNLITALKKQHISLIETEDEISQQLAVLINNRNMKLKSTKENYALPATQSLLKMKETKKLLEKKLSLMEEEISKTENHLMECDKVITQANIEVDQKKISNKLCRKLGL